MGMGEPGQRALRARPQHIGDGSRAEALPLAQASRLAALAAAATPASRGRRWRGLSAISHGFLYGLMAWALLLFGVAIIPGLR